MIHSVVLVDGCPSFIHSFIHTFHIMHFELFPINWLSVSTKLEINTPGCTTHWFSGCSPQQTTDHSVGDNWSGVETWDRLAFSFQSTSCQLNPHTAKARQCNTGTHHPPCYHLTQTSLHRTKCTKHCPPYSTHFPPARFSSNIQLGCSGACARYKGLLCNTSLLLGEQTSKPPSLPP